MVLVRTFLAAVLFLSCATSLAKPSKAKKTGKTKQARSTSSALAAPAEDSPQAQLQSAINAMKAGDYRKSKEISDGVIRSKMPWVLEFEKENKVDSAAIDKKAAEAPESYQHFIWAKAEALSLEYQRDHRKLKGPRERAAKKQIKFYHDVLENLGFDSEKTAKTYARVLEVEQAQKNSVYRFSFRPHFFLSSWRDSFTMSDSLSDYKGQSVAQVYGLGAHLAYSNYSNEFSAGFGIATGSGNLNYAEQAVYDQKNNFTLAKAGAGYLRKLTPMGSGVGIEAEMIGRSTRGTVPLTGSSKSAENVGLVLSAVGRLGFEYVYVDIKGGHVFGQPSAMWTLELGLYL